MQYDRTFLARRTLVALVALVAVAAIAGACSGATATPATTPAASSAPQPTPLPTETPDPSNPPAPVTPVPGDVTGIPQRIIDAALADASARTGVPVGEITVLVAKAVTWPNGALGCPQPGFMYTERIEPGYHVIVDAAGRRLDYRGGSGGAPTLCENPPASG